jgi:hypothetical protein
MSTRSAIIMKTPNGYAGIYCHFDGYEDGVGQQLLDHYTDPAKVAALIELGDISSLGERVAPIGPHSFDKRENGTTTAYHRDRGEEKIQARTGATINDVAFEIGHNGYVYVFDGKWTCNGKQPVDGKFVDVYSSTYGRKAA